MKLEITPCPLCGKVTAPPSKSYAIRYIVAAFLSGGEVTLRGVGNSDDVAAAVRCVKSLGAIISYDGKDALFIGRKEVFSAVLDCGESALVYRMMLPLAAALGVKAKFLLKGRLADRGQQNLIDCLNKNGVVTDGANLEGRLSGGELTVDGATTSQFITGLLFSLPLLGSDASVRVTGGSVSADYIGMTIFTLSEFGVNIAKKGDLYFASGSYSAVKRVFDIERDHSAAAFFLGMGCVGGKVTVSGLNEKSLQADVKSIDILRSFGGNVSVSAEGVTAEKSGLFGTVVDCKNTPDLVPVLAGVAAYANGKTILKNVGRLRFKESDRVTSIVRCLEKAGITSRFDGNDLEITGGVPSGCGFLPTNDHRIVMLEVLLASSAKGKSTILCAENVNKSYPDFFIDFVKVGGKLHVNI